MLSSTLRVDRLTLRNFRCFAECTVDLHPKLTVLIAENGRGKTAVLDAIGLALASLVDTIAGTDQHGFERSDIRRVRRADGTMEDALPTELEAYGSVDGQRIRWSRARKSASPRARTTSKDAEALLRAAKGLRERLEGYAAGSREQPPPLPLVVFYGTGRLWSEHRLYEGKWVNDVSALGRRAAYVDCLSPSSSFKAFVSWYEATANAAQSPTSVAYAPGEHPVKLLAAVREATRTVLAPTGWRDIDWEFPPKDENGVPQGRGQIVIEHPDYGRLPLSVLSDGVRNMIALVADLAHRCIRLNPHFGEAAARLTPGVVLIDEVDMHLHPRWQQLVVELLQNAFPAMQMVLTTHSPHVLSTVDVESIRVIRLRDGQGTLETPAFQTRGVESADVLAAIMGVDPVPQVEQARWTSEYRALIQTDRYDQKEGQQLWVRLVEHFGMDHPIIQELVTLRRLQEFKRTHNLSRSGGA
jgi:predicted ATP-binding protein involved in virulence